MQKKLELLAPAGDMEKLETAFYFGADACYFAGKKWGLRAFSQNFDDDELKKYIEYAHNLDKKAYITVNIQAHNRDFDGLADYIKYLETCKADAVIVSDAGIMALIRETAPNLDIHLSTQACASNKFSAKFWADAGAKRIILARELSLNEIREIRDFLPDNIELEAFVHGAMCISYSGRCLLSNYFTGRDSNHGECVQACRWEYFITEKSRKGQGEEYEIQQDDRSTYILNSKDLCLINYLDKMADAGVTSFKIEGRMKSAYYVANVVNAYRRALDEFENSPENFKPDLSRVTELEKCSHRRFTTGFAEPEKYVMRKDASADFSAQNINSQNENGNVVGGENSISPNSVSAKYLTAENDTTILKGNFKGENSAGEKGSCPKTCSAQNCGNANSTTESESANENCSAKNLNASNTAENGQQNLESEREYLGSSLPVSTYDFIAIALEKTDKDGFTLIEQRNRFKVRDTLEILSPTDTFNRTFIVTEMKDENGNTLTDANLVQQHLFLKTPYVLNARDILRHKK